MSLPTDLDIKTYLRVSTDVEDFLFFDLNNTVRARVEQFHGIPLETESRIFTGRYPRKGPRREAAESLTVPLWPCDTAATITDLDGTTVDPSTYTIDPRTGRVDIERYATFWNPPYTIAIDVGWQLHPQYTTRIEPTLRQIILDLAGELWKLRLPNVEYEQSGGQVSTTYTPANYPPRTLSMLEGLRPRARAW